MLFLFVTNVRLIIENYLKYGFLLSVPGQYVPARDYLLLAACLALLPMHALLALAIESAALDPTTDTAPPLEACDNNTSSLLEKREPLQQHSSPVSDASASQLSSGRPLPMAKTDTMAAWWHTVNISACLLVPSWIVYRYMFHPMLGSVAMFATLTVFLKLISYALTNRALRHAHRYTPSSPSFKAHRQPAAANTFQDPLYQFPANLTVTNVLYFLAAPTLCYQPSYPRNARFRRSFFFKRLQEVGLVGLMIYFLVEQYAAPLLKNSLKALDDQNLPHIAERVLKLSTVSLLIWLLGFYAFFYSWLNALAEVSNSRSNLFIFKVYVS